MFVFISSLSAHEIVRQIRTRRADGLDMALPLARIPAAIIAQAN